MKRYEYFKTIFFVAKSQPARAAYIYLFSSVLNSAIPFLLLPLLTHVLEPSDYGAVAMFQAVFTVAATVTLFGLRAVVLRDLSISASDRRATHISNTVILVAAISLATLGTAWLFSPVLERFSALSLFWILLAVAAGAGSSLFQIYLTVLQADDRPILFGFMQVILSIVNIGITLLFVFNLHYGWIGRALGIAFSSAAGGILAVLLLYVSGLFGRPNRKQMQADFLLGASSMPHAFANVMMAYTDRFFLSAYSTAAIVGVYAIANQLSMALLVFGQALSTASTPWMFRRMAKLSTVKDVERMGLICLGLCLLMLTVSLGFYFVVAFSLKWIVASKYLGALQYLPWLVGAAFFNNIYLFFAPAIFYYRRSDVLSLSGIVIFVAGIAMIYVLSKTFGAVGVAAAMLGSRFLLFAITFVVAVILTIGHLRCERTEILVDPPVNEPILPYS